MTLAVPPLAQVSLDNPDWELFGKFGIGIVVVLWLATGYWTFKGARRRSEDPWPVALATLIGLFPPFLGPIIYMLFPLGPLMRAISEAGRSYAIISKYSEKVRTGVVGHPVSEKGE